MLCKPSIFNGLILFSIFLVSLISGLWYDVFITPLVYLIEISYFYIGSMPLLIIGILVTWKLLNSKYEYEIENNRIKKGILQSSIKQLEKNYNLKSLRGNRDLSMETRRIYKIFNVKKVGYGFFSFVSSLIFFLILIRSLYVVADSVNGQIFNISFKQSGDIRMYFCLFLISFLFFLSKFVLLQNKKVCVCLSLIFSIIISSISLIVPVIISFYMIVNFLINFIQNWIQRAFLVNLEINRIHN